MNKYLIILAALWLVSPAASYGQKKSKEEVALEKEWAKKLKELKPMEYKKLLDEKDSLAMYSSQLERKQSELKSEVDAKDAEIAKLRKEVEDYQSGSAPTTTAHSGSKTGTSPSISSNKGPSKGIVYKVQIGSFKNKDLSKYFDNNPNFSGEVDKDGVKKYTLGAFTDYWEADKFKKALREMGVKDAWIVPYKDGERVNIKDVLEGTL